MAVNPPEQTGRPAPDMMASIVPLAEQALATTIFDHFNNASARLDELCLDTSGILFDFSKTHLDKAFIDAATSWWEASGSAGWERQVDTGAAVNNSEHRAAWHTAWRGTPPPPAVAESVNATNAAMQALVEDWRQSDANAIVLIGIGGSALGPELALTALSPLQPRFDLRVVSNLDASATIRALSGLDPQRTRVIVASKSWTTLETQTNMAFVHQWLRDAGIEAPEAVTVAVTGKTDRARAAGIPDHQILDVPDWVGGRYSLWSAIGLPFALQCGWDDFQALRQGAARMDVHAATAPCAKNAPWLSALMGWLYACVADCGSRAVFAYDDRLRLLPNHLAQLEMESLGKQVSRTGRPVQSGIGALWGGVGTDVQHAVMQAVQQGTETIPVDFIAVAKPDHDRLAQHKLVLANMLAQAAVMMCGRSADDVHAELVASGLSEAEAAELTPHKVCPGNRPSTTILLDSLTPATLGALIAFYEHRTVMLAAMLDINPFDQWGVEIGKSVAHALAQNGAFDSFDPSTAALAQRLL